MTIRFGVPSPQDHSARFSQTIPPGMAPGFELDQPSKVADRPSRTVARKDATGAMSAASGAGVGVEVLFDLSADFGG